MGTDSKHTVTPQARLVNGVEMMNKFTGFPCSLEAKTENKHQWEASKLKWTDYGCTVITGNSGFFYKPIYMLETSMIPPVWNAQFL